jgi:hypothetical protein
MVGRRLQPTADGRIPPLGDFQPGDYCGPVYYRDNDGSLPVDARPFVFYRLPVNLVHGNFGQCASPPHKFRECPDGSLEIRESILHTGSGGTWHGYLSEGHRWREV